MATDKFVDIARIAVAIRSVRATLGWSQKEFADLLGVSKSTVARIETLEINPKAGVVFHAMRLFWEAGVGVDMYKEGLRINVSEKALAESARKLQDVTRRRSDKK